LNNEELKSKLNTFDNDKQLMEEEINNYRKQIEDLQSQKIQVQSTDKENISIIQNDDYEQYRLSIHRQDHSGLDTFFQHLYSSMDVSSDSNEWQISFSKPIDQVKV
jgi:seryl-tRNA synthetase